VKRRHLWLIIVILTLSTVALLLTHQFLTQPNGSVKELLPEVTDCTVQYCITYRQDGNAYHKMDVYLPVGNGPFPVFVYIHGGGWVSGNRSEYNAIGQYYAKRGIAGFSIDYTLATQETSSWPMAIQDVFYAVQYIKANAQQYRVDCERLAVMGDSAGGHLAALAGTLSGNETFLGEARENTAPRRQVSLVIDYYGPTDFEFIGTQGQNFELYWIVTKFLGGTQYWMNPNLWAEASPATYISSDDPTFIIVHGTGDYVVPIAVSEAFKSKLEAASVKTYFIRVEGGNHDILTSNEENTKVQRALEPLLKTLFNLQQQAPVQSQQPTLLLSDPQEQSTKHLLAQAKNNEQTSRLTKKVAAKV
jgi:acetyl esterase/lipase